MVNEINVSLHKLREYCEKEGFKGWDPYDGLNSKVFQALPWIRNNSFAKLAWIQLFKRNPLNLRKIAMVPKDYNPKGLALFLSGYCNLYKIGPKEEYVEKIRFFADKLLTLQSKGFSGACWGYNFDWQSKAFFQPKYTPTIVTSTFIGNSLFDAYEITRNEEYKNTAISVADFILKDLNRTYDNDGDFVFSYSPFDKTRVFNASLLGSRMLSKVYSYTGDKTLIENARKSVAYCCKFQQNDGSWMYSPLPFHQWIDSFHTGYNLECISDYQKESGDLSFLPNIKKGLNYYIANFFTEEGVPKYYNNSVYPVDVHAPSQLILTLNKLGLLNEFSGLVQKVVTWTINNMQDKSGYFYFQKSKHYTIKIPYMRWCQAWMFYSLSTYLLSITLRQSSLTNSSLSCFPMDREEGSTYE
jgi:rhamnogalacturonyl hydrolase YesR